MTLKCPLRFDNKFAETQRTNDKFVTQTHPNTLKHNSSSVLPQLAASFCNYLPPAYSLPYSPAFKGHLMDLSLSATSSRHLNTCLYIHGNLSINLGHVDQVRLPRPVFNTYSMLKPSDVITFHPRGIFQSATLVATTSYQAHQI